MHCPKNVSASAILLLAFMPVGLAVLAGCDAGTGHVGPGSETSESQTDGSGKVGEVSDQSPQDGDSEFRIPIGKDEPLLEDWGRPRFALLLSGEQRGYFEPCGCTATQSGGFSRRDDLLRQMLERDWTVGGFDLGGLVKRSRRQSQIKFETMLEALRDMGYSCMALGPQDLQLGADYLVSQHVPNPEHPEQSLDFLSANVVLFDLPELETPLRSKVLEINGVRVGVTAVLGKIWGDREFPEGNSRLVRVTDPVPAIEKALEQIKGQDPDLTVLLSHCTMDETDALLDRFNDEFDVCITTGGVEDPRGEVRHAGQTLVVDVGHKGKNVGVLGFYPDQDPRFRFELVNLDKYRFQDSKRMVEHMRFYQERLQEEQLAVTELPISDPGTSGAHFVGAAECSECHSKAFEKWAETPHSQAFESLRHPRHGNPDYGITRIYDPECLACHVTGWEPQKVLRFESGFKNAEFVVSEEEKILSRRLEGQQCESCHGPGSRHIAMIEEGDMENALAEVRVSLEQAKDRVCYSCHDIDNSPEFQFDEYWERVAHPWRD